MEKLEVSHEQKDDEVSKKKLLRTLEIIQNSSVKTREVYKGLVYIRTKFLNRPEGIRLLQDSQVFRCLLKMLAHSNEDILNITVSILSNLSNHLVTNEEFREEVVKTKTAGRIALILRNITNTQVQMRTCRLIGTLAQSHEVGEELHRAGLSHTVLMVLARATDKDLLHTTIRALRWLWHIDKYHSDMLKGGVIKTVSNHLLSQHPNVEKAALRALVKFTQQKSIYTAEQMSGTYTWMVEKLEDPVVAVLICNLSQDPRARVELCKAGVVPDIINFLQQGRINSYLISGLCQMCREPMVRASLRQTDNGFQTLLSLLSQEKSKRFYPEILEAITQFNYDQASLMIMVRCGLIGVLVEKLSDYCKAYCHGHTEPVAHDELFSPLSPASPGPASPPTSLPPTSPPPTSPPFATDFSPRCPSPPSDSDSSDEISVSTQLGGLQAGVESGLDGGILEVLRRLTYLGVPMRALSTKTTLTTLLDYISRLQFPRYQSNFHKAVSALSNIVKSKHYWNMLLDDESVLEIHAKLCRPVHQDCWECNRLNLTGQSVLREVGVTAQSGLGVGEITYRLTATSAPACCTAALTVPHVIRQANLLEGLLYTHGGLSLLLQGLSTRTSEAVLSLASLFSTLNVENPQHSSQVCQGCEVGKVRKEGTIWLTVDDGSTLSANREALAHACPVFEAMFRGGFKESTQNSVRISEISASCLSHLIQVLPEYCSCALPKELPVLLEMISASDRFLLPELMERVVGVVRDVALSPLTVAEIYSWGLQRGQQFPLTAGIHHQAVAYLFSAKILPALRIQAVSTIIASPDKDSFLTDISILVRNALTAYTKTQFYRIKPD